MNLWPIISAIREELDRKDGLRERAIGISRKCVRLCRESINLTHRKEFSAAEEKFAEAKRSFSELRSALANYGDIYSAGYVVVAAQELTEACLLHGHLSGRDLPDPVEIGVEGGEYLLGLCDFVGELRREVLVSLMGGDIRGAEAHYRVMEAIYEGISPIAYPRGLIDLKQKTDLCRSMVEKSLEDLTRAKVMKG